MKDEFSVFVTPSDINIRGPSGGKAISIGHFLTLSNRSHLRDLMNEVIESQGKSSSEQRRNVTVSVASHPYLPVSLTLDASKFSLRQHKRKKTLPAVRLRSSIPLHLPANYSASSSLTQTANADRMMDANDMSANNMQNSLQNSAKEEKTQNAPVTARRRMSFPETVDTSFVSKVRGGTFGSSLGITPQHGDADTSHQHRMLEFLPLGPPASHPPPFRRRMSRLTRLGGHQPWISEVAVSSSRVPLLVEGEVELSATKHQAVDDENKANSETVTLQEIQTQNRQRQIQENDMLLSEKKSRLKTVEHSLAIAVGRNSSGDVTAFTMNGAPTTTGVVPQSDTHPTDESLQQQQQAAANSPHKSLTNAGETDQTFSSNSNNPNYNTSWDKNRRIVQLAHPPPNVLLPKSSLNTAVKRPIISSSTANYPSVSPPTVSLCRVSLSSHVSSLVSLLDILLEDAAGIFQRAKDALSVLNTPTVHPINVDLSSSNAPNNNSNNQNNNQNNQNPQKNATSNSGQQQAIANEASQQVLSLVSKSAKSRRRAGRKMTRRRELARHLWREHDTCRGDAEALIQGSDVLTDSVQPCLERAKSRLSNVLSFKKVFDQGSGKGKGKGKTGLSAYSSSLKKSEEEEEDAVYLPTVLGGDPQRFRDLQQQAREEEEDEEDQDGGRKRRRIISSNQVLKIVDETSQPSSFSRGNGIVSSEKGDKSASIEELLAADPSAVKNASLSLKLSLLAKRLLPNSLSQRTPEDEAYLTTIMQHLPSHMSDLISSSANQSNLRLLAPLADILDEPSRVFVSSISLASAAIAFIVKAFSLRRALQSGHAFIQREFAEKLSHFSRQRNNPPCLPIPAGVLRRINERRAKLAQTKEVEASSIAFSLVNARRIALWDPNLLCFRPKTKKRLLRGRKMPLPPPMPSWFANSNNPLSATTGQLCSSAKVAAVQTDKRNLVYSQPAPLPGNSPTADGQHPYFTSNLPLAANMPGNLLTRTPANSALFNLHQQQVKRGRGAVFKSSQTVMTAFHPKRVKREVVFRQSKRATFGMFRVIMRKIRNANRQRNLQRQEEAARRRRRGEEEEEERIMRDQDCELLLPDVVRSSNNSTLLSSSHQPLFFFEDARASLFAQPYSSKNDLGFPTTNAQGFSTNVKMQSGRFASPPFNPSTPSMLPSSFHFKSYSHNYSTYNSNYRQSVLNSMASNQRLFQHNSGQYNNSNYNNQSVGESFTLTHDDESKLFLFSSTHNTQQSQSQRNQNTLYKSNHTNRTMNATNSLSNNISREEEFTFPAATSSTTKSNFTAERLSKLLALSTNYHNNNQIRSNNISSDDNNLTDNQKNTIIDALSLNKPPVTAHQHPEAVRSRSPMLSSSLPPITSHLSPRQQPQANTPRHFNANLYLSSASPSSPPPARSPSTSPPFAPSAVRHGIKNWNLSGISPKQSKALLNSPVTRISPQYVSPSVSPSHPNTVLVNSAEQKRDQTKDDIPTSLSTASADISTSPIFGALLRTGFIKNNNKPSISPLKFQTASEQGLVQKRESPGAPLKSNEATRKLSFSLKQKRKAKFPRLIDTNVEQTNNNISSMSFGLGCYDDEEEEEEEEDVHEDGEKHTTIAKQDAKQIKETADEAALEVEKQHEDGGKEQ